MPLGNNKKAGILYFLTDKIKGIILKKFYEAYSVVGEMGFGWWLVEHYLSYHVDCPDGCGLGEPARGRKDPPGFQVGYGSFDNIADLVDSFVESPLPLQQGSAGSSLERCVAP